MSQNIGKVVGLAAAIGGLGAAYYLMTGTPKDNDALQEPAHLQKSESVVQELPKETDAAKETEAAKEEVKAEETGAAKEEVKAEETGAVKEEEKSEKNSDEAASYTDDTLAATIDGVSRDIKIKDVKKASDMLPPQMRQVPFKTLYPVLVRQAVDFVILEHEAEKEGYNKKEDVLKTIADRKRAVIVAAFLEKEVEAKVSEETLRKKYEDLKKMIPENEKEFEVAHILLKDEASAKTLIKEIKAGKTTFDKALDKSLDEKTKAEKGRIGYLKRMEVAPDFFENVIATKDGDVVSAPLSLGKAGSSVILVMSSRPLEAPAFEKIQDDLRKAMMPELSMGIVKDIKAKSNLKLFNLEGKEMPERTEEELKKIEHEAPSSVDSSKLSADFVCAEFNGGKVLLKDVREAYESLPEVLRMLSLEKIYELILIRTVNERILSDAAQKAGLSDSKKVKEQVAVETKLIVQESYLKSKADALITETDLKSDYNSIVKNMADKNEMEYRIRHIATKTEAEAKDILKKLKAGEKFEDLVDLSIDDATKEKKGEIGYVKKQQLPPEVGTIIEKAIKGTLINQVLKFSDELYSVMRVEDKRPTTPPTFEQMKDKIKNGLMAKKAVQVLEKLREQYKISYKNISGLPTSDEIEKVVKAINSKMNQVLEENKN